MLKKLSSVLLSLLLVMSLSAAAPASAKTQTTQDKINALKLEPLKPSYWNQAFIKRVEAAVKGKKTNFEKLTAVYDYIRTNEVDRKILRGNASGYAIQLACALEIVGFRTYYVAGNPTLKGKEDWNHRWIGIDISGGLLYFDAALPALQGVAVNKCFGIPYQKAPLYKNAQLVQMEIEPILTKDGWMKEALGVSNGIPKSVSNRKPYRNTPDSVYSLYYGKDGDYWKTEWIMPDGTIKYEDNPIIVTDTMGNEFTCYPDGTREPYKKAS